MLLPTTYTTALMLAVFTMLAWGSWANTFKMTKKWRFELFYFDYAFGVLLAAIVAFLTFGMMGEPPTAYENIAYFAGRRNIFYGFGAGVIFNLANMLLVAAISLTGLSVAFPVGIGLALIVGVVLNYFLNPQGNPVYLFGGVAIVLGAIIVDAYAYHAQHEAAPAKAGARGFSGKGLVVALIAGVLMGLFYPLVELSQRSEIGLRPYSVGLMFALGVFFSTMLFNFYFMNLPVEGEPVGFGQYFKGSGRNHLLGLLGGIIWCAGAIANFAAASTPRDVNVGPAVSYALGQGATLISVLWGLLVWREFAGGNGRVKGALALMLVLFVVGLGLISVAPLH